MVSTYGMRHHAKIGPVGLEVSIEELRHAPSKLLSVEETHGTILEAC